MLGSKGGSPVAARLERTGWVPSFDYQVIFIRYLCLFSLVLVQDTAHYYANPALDVCQPELPSHTGWSSRPPSRTGWSPRPPSRTGRRRPPPIAGCLSTRAGPPHSTRCLVSTSRSASLQRMSAYNYPLAQLKMSSFHHMTGLAVAIRIELWPGLTSFVFFMV